MSVTFSFGRAVFLKELRSGQFDAQSVRVTGHLERLDAASRGFVLVEDGDELFVDASFLEELHLRSGASVQVIGEVCVDENGRKLVARVVRDVAGMDLHLYKEAVRLQRRFLMGEACEFAKVR